ncbi:transaldolase [Nocardioides gilvus]|uniref:transaldolase n=1 Tax=Nocardioides gilvus TaxID=1735589 RepID=UPI000D74C72C|nr:transaldolase [Nocardioides gilvus]
MSERLKSLARAGVSIWLDDLSRERLETGNLARLIEENSVVGVTTNPSIFASALAKGERYDAQVAELAAQSVEVEEAVFALTTTDVRQACQLFLPVFEATDGVDGRVSIEVSPALSADAEGTVAQARELVAAVDSPNVLIKVPATPEGLGAITEILGHGISVNVTLIFGLQRYSEVMEAYTAGLELADSRGHDLSTIHSVASFFVSRVDSEIDSRLKESGADQSLFGRAGVANARLAHAAYEEFFSGPRWESLAARGARVQRPLWASTGVKNPDYRDTMYVTDLVAPGTVNTMPEATMQAFADHGEVEGDQISPNHASARATMDALADAGIDYDDVIAQLEVEGVDKFVVSWDELVETVRGQLEKARQA